MRSLRYLLTQYNPRLTVGVEEQVDGKVQRETEIIVYGKLTDLTQLEQAASMESQEQWSILRKGNEAGKGKGSVRVRMSQIPGGEATYVQTIKVKRDATSSLEVETPVTKDIFEMIKFLSDSGMVKDRYRYTIEGSNLVWEVDVFKKPDGSYYPWVKMDLETTTPEAPLPELPIQFEEVITPEDLKGPEADRHNKTLDLLYQEIFKSENPYFSGEKEGSDLSLDPAATPDTPATDPAASTDEGDGKVFLDEKEPA